METCGAMMVGAGPIFFQLYGNWVTITKLIYIAPIGNCNIKNHFVHPNSLTVSLKIYIYIFGGTAGERYFKLNRKLNVEKSDPTHLNPL